MSEPPTQESNFQNYPRNPSQHSVASAGRTLLPAPIASLVTTFTQTASFSLRVGTKVGGFAIAGARETTLTSLELTRAAVEAVLTRAGRDVSERRSDERGRVEAETILERSISSLHHTIASISFFASSGFYLSTAVLTSASTLSVQGLSTLNAVLGSTESSRAVAAIIELIKDEFKKPELGKESEFVGYLDLFSGTVGFVLLQRWARRKTERDFRESGGEEVIWDAVIDDKGFRADVVGTKSTTYVEGLHPAREEQLLRRGRPVSFLSPAGDEAIEAIERGTAYESPTMPLSARDSTRLSDEEIQEHIMSQLPKGCHAVVSSETFTAKTIRADLYDADVAEVTPPPGTVMVREHFHHSQNGSAIGEQPIPSQTVVFRTALRRTSSADVEPIDKLRLTSSNHARLETPYDSDDAVMMRDSSAMRQTQVESSGGPSDQPISAPDSGSDDKEEIHHLALGSSRPAGSPLIPVANQKRARQPVLSAAPNSEAGKLATMMRSKHGSTEKAAAAPSRKQKKVGPFRKALKTLSPSTSSVPIEGEEPVAEPIGGSDEIENAFDAAMNLSRIPRLQSSTRGLQNKALPQLPTQESLTKSAGRRFLSHEAPRAAASPSYFSVREKRHDTMVNETETYSTHSFEGRAGSPTAARTHSRAMSGLSKATSNRDISVWNHDEEVLGGPADSHHRRSRSFISSLYSMASDGSETSLILAPKGFVPRSSIFDDHEVLSALVADGKVPGTFPNDHLVRNVRRYARFASASYGSQFLRFMGLTAPNAKASFTAELDRAEIHHEHNSFSKHTGLPPDTILLSSFEDPHGGIGYSGSPASALPLVHFISIDRESRAVILTCRGTLGFEDVLTDMLCDFDDLSWRGRSYKVHKGIHASARRMLGGKDSRVMATLKAALEEYPDFGLILTGHSLGGAVASLLAILISEPSTVEECGALFATTTAKKLISHPSLNSSMTPPINLPSNRPIHVYAYGPPATLSPTLRLATRGLITTIVNSNDIVPSLSLGILHDFRTVALNLKHDTTGAIAALKSRVWGRVRHAAQSAFYVDSGVAPPPENTAGDGLGEDTWAWAALKTLRAGMCSDKLVPPGEVFVVETNRVFDRQEGSFPATAAVSTDSATERVFMSLGRPATRVQMKLVRDVEGRFGELRFGSRMFSDHSPARYEASLAALETGILEN